MTTPGSVSIEAIDLALEPSGLITRGVAGTGEGQSVVLIGHGGGAFWPIFRAWQSEYPKTENPLDAWSEAIIRPIAKTFGGQAVFPSDRPYHPFQRWAIAALGLTASPIGMLIDPVYGLWHGFRGAILFANDRLLAEDAAADSPIRLCDNCVEKPCLTACPVGAVSLEAYDVPRCRAHLASREAQTGCMAKGCLSRLACPVGAEWRYGQEQQEFHISAFAGVSA